MKQPQYLPTPFTESHAVNDSFQADPSYAFRFGQGVQAQDQSAAAKGTLLSGAQQQALTNYGQGAASQEYQAWYNRLMGQNQFNLAGNLQERTPRTSASSRQFMATSRASGTTRWRF